MAIKQLHTADTCVNTTVHADADGMFHLRLPASEIVSRDHATFQPILYASSPTGVATRLIDRAAQMGNTLTLTLQPLTSVRLHCVDENNQPAAHVRIVPQGFATNQTYMPWFEAVANRWTV